MPERRGSKSIRVLIADDEVLARRRIRDMLRDQVDIEIVGESATGTETITAIDEFAPDLIFLDVQVPGINGIEVAKALQNPQSPLVIFVTAYDQYAVSAFEVRAVDYLLKPFDRDRFQRALEQAKRELRNRRSSLINDEVVSLLTELRQRPQFLDRLLIRSNDRVSVIKTDEIDWIEAEGNYVRIHFGKQSSLLRQTLISLAMQLDPRKFSRIHRSQIVNIDRVHELQPWSNRQHRVVLKNGKELSLSRRYRDQFYQLLGKV